MRRILLSTTLAVSAIALTACASRPDMYSWGPYEDQVYAFFKNEPVEKQIAVLEKHAQETQAKGQQLPPGYRAHLGLLYEKAGRGPDFVAALQQEKAAFPESAPYIDKLLSGPETKSKTEAKAKTGAKQ